MLRSDRIPLMLTWLRKPFPFCAHETGFSFKAGYFRLARQPPTLELGRIPQFV